MPPSKSVSCLCVSLLLAAGVSCVTETPQAGPEVPPVQNHEAVYRSERLKEIWTAEESRLHRNSRSYSGEKLDLLAALLDRLPDEQVEWEMERLLANPTARSKVSNYEDALYGGAFHEDILYEETLLQALAVRGVRRRDREMLVRMFSVRCPRAVALDAVELYLAFTDLPDPLLILFESYQRAANEEARATLYDALSKLCSIPRETFSNDRDYISAVEEWYRTNKDRVEVNPYYHPMAFHGTRRLLFEEP